MIDGIERCWMHILNVTAKKFGDFSCAVVGYNIRIILTENRLVITEVYGQHSLFIGEL